MSLHGELAGAAARWRERRLRSCLRHERQTVAMVLAEACHHSSRTFPPTLKDGRPKRVRSRTGTGRPGQWVSGRRQEALEEVVESQGAAITVGYVTAPVPSLAVPLLAKLWTPPRSGSSQPPL